MLPDNVCSKLRMVQMRVCVVRISFVAVLGAPLSLVSHGLLRLIALICGCLWFIAAHSVAADRQDLCLQSLVSKCPMELFVQG